MNSQSKPKRKENQTKKQYVSLPWIPGLSTKLRKVFKNVGYSVSFKSPSNLKQILTTCNKDQLPPNSQPGVYLIPCECKSRYTGETKKRILSRNKEHEKDVFLGNVKDSALAVHCSKCNGNIQWSNTRTLAIEPNYFRRCVRESLEIRRNKTGPNDEHGINQDYGKYVKTDTWNSMLHHRKLRSSYQARIENTSSPTSANETMTLSTSGSETTLVTTSHNNEPTE